MVLWQDQRLSIAFVCQCLFVLRLNPSHHFNLCLSSTPLAQNVTRFTRSGQSGCSSVFLPRSQHLCEMLTLSVYWTCVY